MVNKAIKKKEFSIEDLQNKFSSNTRYKPDSFLSCGQAFTEAAGISGPAIGHLNMLLGHTNTSKTSALIATAVDAQKKGILPVFIITEKKWSFEHCKIMGFDCVEKEDGTWGGFFLYRDDFNYLEQIFEYINTLLEAQEKGELNYDLCFLWDSIGSIPCKMTWEGKGGKMHTAGVLAEKINMGLNQKINNSRKEDSKYTNTLVVCNLPWVKLPDNPFGKPKMKAKGGEALYQASTMVFRFGNEADGGLSKLDATANGRKVNFAMRTKVTVDKNHINGLGYVDGAIIITPHGYIKNDKSAIDKYKSESKEYWINMLGTGDFEIDEEKIEVPVDYEDQD